MNQFKTSFENESIWDKNLPQNVLCVSGRLWLTSPPERTHTCSTPRPFSSQSGFSWVFSAALLWWEQPQESSPLSYPFFFSDTRSEFNTQKGDFHIGVFASLTRLSRHQVHQAALFPAAGDGPLLPHVLEHLPAGGSLRVHRWAGRRLDVDGSVPMFPGSYVPRSG